MIFIVMNNDNGPPARIQISENKDGETTVSFGVAYM